jgi:hypothetical protein
MHVKTPLAILSLLLTPIIATPVPDGPQHCSVTVGAGVGIKAPGDSGLNDNGDWYSVPVGCNVKTEPCGGRLRPANLSQCVRDGHLVHTRKHISAVGGCEVLWDGRAPEEWGELYTRGMGVLICFVERELCGGKMG